jgi:hypothetical protein
MRTLISAINNAATPLDISLPDSDINLINQVISDVQDLSALSANQTLVQLQKQGLSAKIFSGLRAFLGLVEGVRDKTYPINGHMTIGIGLDLTVNKDALVLFTK